MDHEVQCDMFIRFLAMALLMAVAEGQAVAYNNYRAISCEALKAHRIEEVVSKTGLALPAWRVSAWMGYANTQTNIHSYFWQPYCCEIQKEIILRKHVIVKVEDGSDLAGGAEEREIFLIYKKGDDRDRGIEVLVSPKAQQDLDAIFKEAMQRKEIKLFAQGYEVCYMLGIPFTGRDLLQYKDYFPRVHNAFPFATVGAFRVNRFFAQPQEGFEQTSRLMGSSVRCDFGVEQFGAMFVRRVNIIRKAVDPDHYTYVATDAESEWNGDFEVVVELDVANITDKNQGLVSSCEGVLPGGRYKVLGYATYSADTPVYSRIDQGTPEENTKFLYNGKLQPIWHINAFLPD